MSFTLLDKIAISFLQHFQHLNSVLLSGRRTISVLDMHYHASTKPVSDHFTHCQTTGKLTLLLSYLWLCPLNFCWNKLMLNRMLHRMFYFHDNWLICLALWSIHSILCILNTSKARSIAGWGEGCVVAPAPFGRRKRFFIYIKKMIYHGVTPLPHYFGTT